LLYFAKEGVSMARLLLTDEDWALIADVFPSPAATGRPRCNPRRVLEEFGTWKTAWRMFDQWNGDGTFDAILRRLQSSFATAGAIDIDQRLWCIDGTTVRAARCAGGGGKKAMRRNLATTR
jgi:transposase